MKKSLDSIPTSSKIKFDETEEHDSSSEDVSCSNNTNIIYIYVRLFYEQIYICVVYISNLSHLISDGASMKTSLKLIKFMPERGLKARARSENN